MGPTESATPAKPGALRRFCGSLRRIVLTLAVLYALVCLGARWLSTKLLFPAPPPSYDSTLSGLVMIPGEAGLRVAALHLPNPKAKHLLVFFHGNGEDLGIDAARIEAFRDAGFAVLAIDYPGYGLTGGKASEAGLCAAADAAYAYATGHLGWAPEHVILYGLSLGGSAAVWVAAHERVGGLVLESTFTSAYRVITGWPLVVGERLPSILRIGRVRCPVFVLHGTTDDVIGIAHGKALFAAAPEPKRFMWVDGAGHCQVPEVAGASYWRALGEFAASLP